MSIVRTFYKKFCENFFDRQILSAKAFLAQTAIQYLFHQYKEVKPSIKCFPNEQKKAQIIPTKTSRLLYSDSEFMAQSVGIPLYFNEKTKNSKRISCRGKIFPETKKIVQNIFIYFGSTNSAGHGVLRMLVEPEGEMIKSAYPHTKLLHRGNEKLVEHNTFFLALTHFDRLNYTFCIENCNSLAVKKLPNTDIALSVSTQLLQSGVGIGPSYEFCNLVSGVRLLSNNIRTCRSTSEISIGLMGDIYELCVKYPERLDDLIGNGKPIRISLAKATGMGNFSSHDDSNIGFSEAVLSQTVNKWEPYNVYEKSDIPMAIIGDSYYQFLYRVEVMCQPIHIIDHCLIKMPTRGIQLDDPNIYSSKRFEMKPSREDLIHHFNYINLVFLISPGQNNTAMETPKDEFGGYLISNGATHPNRCNILAPCFPPSNVLASLSTNLFLPKTPGFLDFMEIDF